MTLNATLKSNRKSILTLVAIVFVALYILHEQENRPVFGNSVESLYFCGAFGLLSYLAYHTYSGNIYTSYVVGIFVYIVSLYTVAGLSL